jgi:hypothetical protein
MSAAPVRPSTPYINAAPAIIAHPLALQFNRVSISSTPLTLGQSPWAVAFSTIVPIKAVHIAKYAAMLPSVTACPTRRQCMTASMANVGRRSNPRGRDRPLRAPTSLSKARSRSGNSPKGRSPGVPLRMLQQSDRPSNEHDGGGVRGWLACSSCAASLGRRSGGSARRETRRKPEKPGSARSCNSR